MTDSILQTRSPAITPLEKRLMLDASLPVIAGQVLWLDAADANTIRDGDGDYAATGTGGANNGFGGTVATWVDKSGSGFNVTNATPSQQPTYTLGGLNGKNILTFDGTQDKLTNTSAVIPGNDYTAFVVFNRTTASGRDGVFELGAGGSRNALFVNNSSSKLGYYINGTFVNSTSNYVANTYEMVSITHDTSTFGLWRNGVSDGGGTYGSARVSTTGIYVGDDSSSGDQLQGNIAELIVYDFDLTTDQRRDVENYLASKWGFTITDVTPVIAANTGDTLLQGTGVTITSAKLSSTDTDNSESILRYTITDLTDYGSLTNTNTSHTYILGETFTQADIDAGYIHYTHNNTTNFTDSFSFTVSDGYATTASSSFNFSITPSNVAPVIDGWTLVSSENFESGATGWSDNLTTSGGTYLSKFLGRHSQEAGVQNTYKTYTLSGAESYTVIEFDMYKIDSWDGEAFKVFVDDSQIISINLINNSFATPVDGTSGAVSYTVQEMTPFLANFAFGTWNEQIFRFTLTVNNSAAATIKLGFSSTLDQAITDESWGVDNVKVYEVASGGTPAPLGIVENSSIGTVVGKITATDANIGDVITYSIVGGTGAGTFNINSSTGVITTAAALDYETISSYTLDVRATDNGTGSLFDTKTITINILDMPENTAPSIAALGPLSVSEAAVNNTVIGTALGTDPDGDTLTYSIVSGNTDNIFAINSSTGAIRISSNANLNHEWASSYTLSIRTTDNGFGTLSATRNVVVNIADINETPTFNIPQSFLNENPYLRYNAATGNFYRYVSTTASNAAATAAASAAMLNGVAGHLVTISDAAENAYVRALGSGALWLGGTDSVTEGNWIWGGSGPEGGQVFSVGSAAQGSFYTNWLAGQPDNGSNSDFLEMATSGLWTDVNGGNRAYVIEWEGAAVLSALGNGPFTLAENPVLNQSVGFVHARDADAGDTISYSITGGAGAGHFAINASTGEITVTNPSAINYEGASSYTLDLRVQDAVGLFDTRTIAINITDANDIPTALSLTGNSIVENSAIGTVIGTFNTIDEDISDTHIYSLLTNPGGKFTIVGNQIRSAADIDYEVTQSITITVRTDDGNGGTLDKSFLIQVGDVLDTFTPPPASGPTGGAGLYVPPEESLQNNFQNLLGSGLGGEESQSLGFYGADKWQVLRQNITFKIREIIAMFVQKPQDLENLEGPQTTKDMAMPAQEIGVSPSHYTNLREALEFLQQLDNADKHKNPENDNIAKERTKILPANTIDRQFVDVMTYHQERAAKLREALAAV